MNVEIFDKYKSDKNKLHLRKYNPIKCKTANHLKANELHVTLEDFLCFLSFLKNIEILIIKDSKIINIKGSRDYKLTTILLLITNYVDMDNTTCEKIKSIPMPR
ncbi:hypothetical protein K502DRAFT_325908 [Neoconidiobolus thromboides FSU 785]|nr:hypothetical protein K502DRAFT_325908 [Neoconidiobolus thromboides FSU 785]